MSYSITPTKFEVSCILTPRDKGSWILLDSGFIIIPNNYVNDEIEKVINKVLKDNGQHTIITRQLSI